ncbi:MAG: hypothetical protein U1E65_19370 [Myxococcota bacterium]
MRAPVIAAAGIALLGAACGPTSQHVTLSEPSLSDVLLRVAVVLTPEDRAVALLGKDAAFQPDISAWAPADLDVWIFLFRRPELEAAFPALAGQDAEAMLHNLEVHFVGPDEVLPAPPAAAKILRAQVPRGALAASYAAVPADAWDQEQALHPSHSFRLEISDTLACQPLSAEIIELPSGIRASRVIATGERSALFAGSSSGAAVLGTITGTSATISAPIALPGGWSGSFVWDPLLRRVLAISGDQLFALDEQAGPLTLPAFDPPESIPVEVAVGRDGTVGTVVNGETHLLTAQGWESEGVGSVNPRPPSALIILDHDHHTAFRDCWVMSMVFSASPAPSFEWNYDKYVGCKRPRAMARDGVTIYDIDRDGRIYERLSFAVWREWLGIDPNLAQTVVGLGARRFAIGGDEGYLRVRLRSRNCPVTAPPDLRLGGASAWLDTGVAYFLLVDPSTGDAGKLLWLRARGPG